MEVSYISSKEFYVLSVYYAPEISPKIPKENRQFLVMPILMMLLQVMIERREERQTEREDVAHEAIINDASFQAQHMLAWHHYS